MGDDVVQLARDTGSLLHRRLLALAQRHPLLRRGERGDDLRPSPGRLPDDHRRDDEQEGHDAREPGGAAVERDRSIDEERQRERGAVHEAATGNEVAGQVEEDADRGERQRRLPGGEQHEDAERCRAGGDEREPGGDEERRDRQHVEEDGQRRVALLLEREALVDVGRVDARLERRDDGEDERQGDPAVASREHALRDDERTLAVSDELHGGIVASLARLRVARDRDLPPPSHGGVRGRGSPARGARKTPLTRDAVAPRPAVPSEPWM